VQNSGHIAQNVAREDVEQHNPIASSMLPATPTPSESVSKALNYGSLWY